MYIYICMASSRTRSSTRFDDTWRRCYLSTTLRRRRLDLMSRP